MLFNLFNMDYNNKQENGRKKELSTTEYKTVIELVK